MVEVVKPVDFKQMIMKNYTSFGELREDIAWFGHNCMAQHSSNNSKSAKDIFKAATNLLNLVDKEISKALLCSECYANAYYHPLDSFVLPCEKPHLLIWVDCEDYGFWPAKMIKFDDENMVWVQYFGDHTSAVVTSSNCRIFSKDMPEHKNGSAIGSLYEHATVVSLFSLICSKI